LNELEGLAPLLKFIKKANKKYKGYSKGLEKEKEGS
jgi:hypothetical protein